MPSVANNFKQLWYQVSIQYRIQILTLFVFMFFSSFLEVISIGAIVPFLGILATPDVFFQLPPVLLLANFIGVKSAQELLLPLVAIFCVAAIISGIARLSLLKLNIKVSFLIGAELSNAIYRRTLYQPYHIHISRNSSAVIDGISKKVDVVIYGCILQALALLTSVSMLLSIFTVLLYVDTVSTCFIFFGLGMIYGLLAFVTRSKKIQNGKDIAQESTKVIKVLQEGLGGVRDILIDCTQEIYCAVFRGADQKLRKAQANNQFLAQSPRYGIEMLGMVLVALAAYFLSLNSGGLLGAIPLIGLIALAAQRLLPVMQQAYSSWSMIQSSQASLYEVLNLLKQPTQHMDTFVDKSALSFSNFVHLKNVWFRYDVTQPWIIKGIDLKIYKGSCVGFLGQTGSGKSTLLDLVMGLLDPSKGELLVDGRVVNADNRQAWFSRIAHVPQSIFLSDSTIRENIAFGVPKESIDNRRVVESAKIAQIDYDITSFPLGYDTMVGERGVRLSGGQRQRIGIARAIYKNAELIIFDEATSALDGETEDRVISSVNLFSNNLTTLIISHKMTALSGCSKIFEVDNGGITEKINYSAPFNFIKK